MIFENVEELRARAQAVIGRKIYSLPKITDDTSNYMQISNGSVLRLGGQDYYITGEATEGRFGISDQPKYWVKYAYELESGARKIIKLVFHESFTTTMGFFTFRLTRNPDKESRVLEVVKGDARFMQGETLRDAKGNNVRIIDFIRGKTMYNTLATLPQKHEEYYYETLPTVLTKLAGCLDALEFLHENGLQHGDVRNDHILIERDSEVFRWIDFDYEVNYGDYDVWSVGNLLTYVVGKGIHTCRDVSLVCAESEPSVGPDDALLMFRHRLANIRKLYPYVSEDLNEMMMRFATSTVDFYEDVATISRDLRSIIAQLS
jgi:hypothetical protein